MQVVVDELLTGYQLQGKGKLVLLLHGWGDSAKGLKDLADQLAAKYQVLSVDLPGFGSTQSPKVVWDLDNYSAFIASLLSKLGLSQPYAVIGHSNGGALAIRSIGQAKISPDKLILLAASGIRPSKTLKRFILQIIAKTGNIAALWMPERYRQALRKSLYGAAGSDALVAPHLAATFKKTVRQDVQADAAKLDLSTLLIYGSEDKATPPEFGQHYQQLIKDSRLEILDGASHFVQHDQPGKVAALIEDFLK
jgi:pimeloyl-ACP methyl ester carboxylesterase